MLLIHPPMAKACEPPAGIAKLAGSLRAHGLPCRLLDANLEGQLFLLGQGGEGQDTWSRRAMKNRVENLTLLRAPTTYQNRGRYQRAVADLNRVLDLAGRPHSAHLSLANYQEKGLSPLNSADLLTAAGFPERSPFFPWFSVRLPALLTESPSATVGFSLNYLSQALPTFAMAGFLKRVAPSIRIILGGGLVTSWLRRPAWRNPFAEIIDHLIQGPGEEPLLALLAGQEQSRLAPPDFFDLPLDAYLAPGLILPYPASSGCYWNRCSFCPEKAEANPYLPLAPERVMADLDLLIDRHRPLLLHFLDNAVSPALMRAMIDRPSPLPWYGFARVCRPLTDPDFCVALRASGCRMLKLGLESGDQGVLDAMDKGIDLAMVDKALQALRQAGIATYIYLLFGTPSESLTEARATLEFTARHHRAITYLNLAIFNLPLGSEEGKSLPLRDFYAGDLSLYHDFQHPRGWQRREIRAFLDREFKAHPRIAPILRRDPPLFTSNHASLFHL